MGDVDAQLADFQELLITFCIGLAVGIIPTYIGHWLSVRHSKKEQISPYLQKMYGIVSRIMTKTDAEKLGDRYQMLQKTRIEEEMRESARKKLNIEPNNVFESFGTSFVAYSFFVLSFNNLIETIRECGEFELVFSDMDQKGILATLRLRDEGLHNELSWFHQSSKYIVEETKDVANELRTTTEANDKAKVGSMSQSQAFQKIMMLRPHNLFQFGKSLEKRLRKYV